MAELLIRVVDKVNEDFYLNCQCTKRGDVVVAQPDGWAWGLEELKNPDWRIVVMPELSLGDAQAMLAPELDKDPKSPSKTLQRRAFKFDLDALATSSPDAKAFLADGKRSSPIIKFVADVKDAGVAQVAIATDVLRDADSKPILDQNGKPTPIMLAVDQTATKVSAADLLALKVEKPPTPDPGIIGDNKLAVIG